MKSKYIDYSIAVAIGITLTVIQWVMHHIYLIPQSDRGEMLLTIAYPVVIIVSFGIGYYRSINPWRWPLVLIGSFYLGLLVLGYGQMPPLEVLALLILMLPVVLAIFIAKALRKKKSKLDSQTV